MVYYGDPAFSRAARELPGTGVAVPDLFAHTCAPSCLFTPPPLPQVTEGRRSLSTFLTGLCAIVGGVFTVAGMLDSCLFRLGKLSGSP